MSFHNSIDIAGKTLKTAEKKVIKQEQQIMDWFIAHPYSLPTPWQLQDALKANGIDMLITSVRRGLTNLTNDGKLVKSEIQLVGKQGMTNHTWRLNIKPTAADKRKSKKKSVKRKPQPILVLQPNLFQS